MANPYYTPTGNPPNQTRGTSALVRNEFDSIEVGFDDVYAEILALAAAIGVAVTVSEVPLASASTTDIGNGYGPVLLITGSNPINSFGANYNGGIFLRFQGSLQINHSSTLQCPGGINITTQADDACIAVPIGNPANGWRIMAYCRVSQGIIDDIAVKTSSTYADPAWLTSLAWSKITGKPTTLAGYGITDAPQKDGTGATGSWPINITGWAKSVGAGADIASAATLPLAARTGNLVRVTGTVATIATDLENGGQVWCYAVGAWPLTYHATNMPVQGGANYTCSPGDIIFMSRDGSGVLTVLVHKADGTGTRTVNLSGNQTVAGVKTFSSAAVLQAGATFGNATLANLSTSAPLFGARAFGVFDGRTTGTFAPSNSGNVSSITRNSAGDYTVTLSTAMGTTDYAVIASARSTSVPTYAIWEGEDNTTTTFRITAKQEGAGLVDCAYVAFAVFRT